MCCHTFPVIKHPFSPTHLCRLQLLFQQDKIYRNLYINNEGLSTLPGKIPWDSVISSQRYMLHTLQPTLCYLFMMEKHSTQLFKLQLFLTFQSNMTESFFCQKYKSSRKCIFMTSMSGKTSQKEIYQKISVATPLETSFPSACTKF